MTLSGRCLTSMWVPLAFLTAQTFARSTAACALLQRAKPSTGTSTRKTTTRLRCGWHLVHMHMLRRAEDESYTGYDDDGLLGRPWHLQMNS
ncbi:hypothetical protein GY45DRAFT_99628 [Cubamyces sp. BRFM 1775]|nr:hypothetical protein GY45DRAFT_99628 [Cubamyces sp. BRFM 1775]